MTVLSLNCHSLNAKFDSLKLYLQELKNIILNFASSAFITTFLVGRVV